jgi:DNA-binding transcriptional ArsR family regulator
MSNLRITETDRLLADYCHAISSPRRNLLIRILAERERTVGELAALTGFSFSNISQHLKVLRDKRIVSVDRAGSHATYRVAQPALLAAMASLREAVLAGLRAGVDVGLDDESGAAAGREGGQP